MKNNQSFQNDPVIKKANENSNFRAIKSLVNTQNCLKVAHNRIKVLEANENKNHIKIQNQLGLIQKIQKARQAQSQHITLMEAGKQQFDKQYNEVIAKNKEMINQIKAKIQSNASQLRQQRRFQYLKIEENSQNADKIIAESKSKDHKQKEQHTQTIKEKEQQSKSNLMKFYQHKQSRIKQSKINQIQSIKSKQSYRQRQLRQMSNIEMELIQKQSQSQAAYLQVKHKLDSLLTNVKQQNSRSKKSMKVSMHLSGANI